MSVGARWLLGGGIYVAGFVFVLAASIVENHFETGEFDIDDGAFILGLGWPVALAIGLLFAAAVLVAGICAIGPYHVVEAVVKALHSRRSASPSEEGT